MQLFDAVTAAAALPHSFEDEQRVIGAVLLDEDALPLVTAAGLRLEHFTDEAHRLTWAAVEALAGAGKPVDMVTVFQELQARGNDERAGGLPYINSMCTAVEATKAAGVHAAVVVDRARRRKLVQDAELLRNVASGGGSAADLQRVVSALAASLADQSNTAAPRPSIPLEWAHDIPDELQAPPQIVEGVLTAGGMSMMFGESNSGKSYLAIHLGICVSLGEPWLGRRTKRGAVLYVAAEGAWSIRGRLAAYRKHHGQPVGTFGLIPCALSLVDPSADVEELIRLIRDEAAKLPEPVSLVIVDTVARVMAGGDENTAQDMGRLVGAADHIREETGAHMLYIHHAGKDASRGARGHSSLRAALDTEIEVTADESAKVHMAKVTKQRDLASKGETFAAKFVPVELGLDQWGGAITACAVVETDTQAGPSARRMSKGAQAVMAYLQGTDTGTRRAAIVDALAKQGISQAGVYRSCAELLELGLVTDVNRLLYVPKG
jgi:hypothetical protein